MYLYILYINAKMDAPLYFHKLYYFCDAISDQNESELLKEILQRIIGSSLFHAVISVVVFANDICN